MKKIESNVWKLYGIRGLRSFMLIMPVMVLFFEENGLSLRDIFVLQALFSLVLIILEVPTGYFADRFSRKASLVLGGVVSTLGWALYASTYSFWGFLGAEILLGIGMSFVSGADSAMLYDTLVSLDQEGEYQQMEGRNLSVGLFSEGVSSIIGGFLAVASLRLPLYLDVLSTLCIVPLALSLVEPSRRKATSGEGGSFRHMREAVMYALHGQREVKWLIGYSAVVSVSTLTMVWFIQPYLKTMQVSIRDFGFLWAGLLCVAAFSSWYAHQTERSFGRRAFLVCLVILPAIGYGMISAFWLQWSMMFLCCFFVTRGMLGPVLSNCVNVLVSSDIRATVLSVKNLIGRVVFAIVGPIAGWIGDVVSLRVALAACGGTFLLLGCVTLVAMGRRKLI